MALVTQNFSTLVSNMAAAVQSACASILDLSVGSFARAMMEANASAALWLQWLILQVLSLTRLATSTGADVDSWVGDFGLTRLPATASSGPVTFSRYSNLVSAFIPVGAQVKTSDATRIFQVVADNTNPAWNGSTGFNLPSGTSSLTVSVIDVTTDQFGNPSIGTAGNVMANTISLLATSIAGVDTVNNSAPFTNGINKESDAALQLRFQTYIQTLREGTLAAVVYAVTSLGQNITCSIQENVSVTGTYMPGNFVATVDDGSGAPSSTLLANASAAINAVRPLCSSWTVLGPIVTTATVNLTIQCTPTTAKTATLILAVQNALLAYIDGLTDGATLPYSRLAMVAYATDPSISDVVGVTLNGGTADIVPPVGGAIKATSGTVTVT